MERKEINSLKDDIVKALADIEKAALLLNTYEKCGQDDLYIDMAQNFIIQSKNRILEVIGALDEMEAV